MGLTYFFDTYAFYEVMASNPGYRPYSKEGIITTELNLFEFTYTFARLFSFQGAMQMFDRLKDYCVPYSDEDIKMACKLKLRNRKLSYADCLGYVVSLRLGIPFLTGDKEFEGMEAVEFVR